MNERNCSGVEWRYWVSFVWNIVLAYVVYMLCRVVYVWENWAVLGRGWSDLHLNELLAGSLRFDTAAICYTHILYAVLMLLPIGLRRHKVYQMIAKCVYVGVNGLAVCMNLVDAVYSQYTGRRTTSTFFSEFQNDGNLVGIVGVELVRHWYLVLVGIALIAMLWMLYRMPKTDPQRLSGRLPRWVSPVAEGCVLVMVIVLSVVGIRGWVSKAIRPITISNANQYVNSPSEAAMVLNTPFSLIRTLGKTTFVNPGYFESEELDNLYSPVHRPHVRLSSSSSDEAHNDLLPCKKNVVVIIVESFASEYIGALNDYRGYTPFMDSLIGQSLTYRQSYCNGRKSIDGMPSILSSIPMFVEPFFVTSYSLNKVSGLAGELSRWGYATAFFHGAENGSMGFQAFARATGFQRYYGRTEYDADNRFGGEADFDGTWAIWDEPFLQYYATVMSEMQEPFMTAVFTASSHHPFAVPERYRDSLHEEGHPMYTCIRYTDMALRRFFETASCQPWFANTVFVITADHTNVSEREQYLTDIGRYMVPIVFYDPSGALPAERRSGIAQQIDIMPTLLGLLGYDEPYIAYGIDLLHTADSATWAVNYNNGIYQYVEGNIMLQFDGRAIVALYDMDADPLLKANLKDVESYAEDRLRMESRLKAILQSYMDRMINDRLVIND